MNHRERVLTSLRHQEPDRVPIDFGATTASSILGVPYRHLREHVQLPDLPISLRHVGAELAIVDADVLRMFDVDVRSVADQPKEWRSGTLKDGSPAQVPATFLPLKREDGSEVIVDSFGKVEHVRPSSAYTFSRVHSPLAEAETVTDIDKQMRYIESIDSSSYMDKTYEQLADEAKRIRCDCDCALVGDYSGHIFGAAESLRGFDTFLMDLLVNQAFAAALMDRITEVHMERFARYARTVGRHVDVVVFADDLGMQDRPLLRPELYRKMVKPFHQKLFSFVKSVCDAQILLHTDGAIAPFIPDFIEIGVDILNPVQVSADGMDTRELKSQFGREISFWGAGCDSQKTLPFGTPQQVADEVKRRIDDLAPGGGFVFAPVHNIQPGVPPENIVSMFETALAYGG